MHNLQLKHISPADSGLDPAQMAPFINDRPFVTSNIIMNLTRLKRILLALTSLSDDKANTASP
jgi:hypothetical protein